MWSFSECTFHCTAEHLDNVIENQLFQLQNHILNSLIMWLKTRSSSCSIKNEKHFMLPSYLRILLLLLVESHVKRLPIFVCFDVHTCEIRMIRSWQHTAQTHKQLPCQDNSIKFNVWKSWKHDHECCLFVPSSLYQWCHKQGWHVLTIIWNRSQVTLFLLFVGKEWTSLAGAWGAQKNKWKYWSNNEMKPAESHIFIF